MAADGWSDDKFTKQLAKLYYATGDPGSYGGIERLYKRARELGIPVSRARVTQFLQAQQAYTLHRPVRHRFKRNQTFVAHIDQQWQADLADMQAIAGDNDGYKYLLTCIDVLSKYAWVVPVKTKSGTDVRSAFRVILKRALPRKPKRLQTDKGKEFFNSEMRSLLVSQNIHHFASESDQKAAVVERFNRTLKTRIWTYFTANNTKRYTNILQDIVHAYNHSMHRSIGMHPADCDNPQAELTAWRRLYYDHTIPKEEREGERPGQNGGSTKKSAVARNKLVRISKWKHEFEKGYVPSWSREHFKVSKVLQHPEPVYKLEDADGEAIDGVFYRSEIQPIARNIYEVEKVLPGERRQAGTRLKEVLVKWKGLPEKFNRWILKSELAKYQRSTAQQWQT